MQCLLMYRTRSDHNWRHIWNCFSLPSRPLDPTLLQLPKLKLFNLGLLIPGRTLTPNNLYSRFGAVEVYLF